MHTVDGLTSYWLSCQWESCAAQRKFSNTQPSSLSELRERSAEARPFSTRVRRTTIALWITFSLGRKLFGIFYVFAFFWYHFGRLSTTNWWDTGYCTGRPCLVLLPCKRLWRLIRLGITMGDFNIRKYCFFFLDLASAWTVFVLFRQILRYWCANCSGVNCVLNEWMNEPSGPVVSFFGHWSVTLEHRCLGVNINLFCHLLTLTFVFGLV